MIITLLRKEISTFFFNDFKQTKELIDFYFFLLYLKQLLRYTY